MFQTTNQNPMKNPAKSLLLTVKSHGKSYKKNPGDPDSQTADELRVGAKLPWADSMGGEGCHQPFPFRKYIWLSNWLCDM